MQNLKKIKSGFKKSIKKSLLGNDEIGTVESGILHNMNKVFGLNSISSLLPFQFYDAESEIFHNNESKGVLLEARPMSGASEDHAEVLYNFLQRILPEGAIVQFLLHASPNIGHELDAYAFERQNHSQILEKNAKHRSAFFKKGAYKSLIPGQNIVLRDYKLYITLVFDNALGLSDAAIQSYANRLIGTLKGMGVQAKSMHPEQFLSLIDGLLRPYQSVYPTEFSHSGVHTLSEQLSAPNHSHKITAQRIVVDEGEFEMRSFRVADFPRQPVSLYEMGDLIGSVFDNNSRIGCPFFYSFIIKIAHQAKEREMANLRAPRANQRAMMIGRLSPKAIEHAQEARDIVKQFQDGERLVLADFQVVLYYPAGQGDEHEAALMNVFQAPAKKWRLVKNNMLQMVALMAHLPLSQSFGLFNDLQSLGLTHKIWAKNAANMAPMIAEMKGMDSRRFMISGRRGQILFWDPFGNNRGNYNTCVAGISGSGKSVTVQEIASSLIGTGARVWIIDVGRSYKKLCQLLDGQFIEFTRTSNLCLNPFSTVNVEEIDEFFAFMTPLISLMADPNQKTSAFESALIEQAIKAAWNAKGKAGSIGDIAAWLISHSDKRANDIGTMLYPYTSEGQYGRYFNGEANVNFDNAIVVFELEEINSNKRLQSIIFMLLMFHVTEKMYLGQRTTQMALIIDEAWDMLKGGHGANIIESIARRARKYKGCLITITQSISDFFASAAGQAAYNNSYWRILHAQNKANVSTLLNEKRITLDPFQERLLYSLSTEHGQYSEMMIQGDGGEYTVGRLVLDPYSRILFSTQGDEFAAVEALCKQGVPIAEAIEQVTERIFGK